MWTRLRKLTIAGKAKIISKTSRLRTDFILQISFEKGEGLDRGKFASRHLLPLNCVRVNLDEGRSFFDSNDPRKCHLVNGTKSIAKNQRLVR